MGFSSTRPAAREKLVEGGVHIRAAKEERDVVVRGKACRIGQVRALAFVISRVEHERVAAPTQHGPMEVVALAAMDDRRVASELETRHFAVELHRRGHVENLQERT